MGFADFDLAAQARDVIRDMVASEIKRLRPETRVAKVVTVNRENLTAEVAFSGDEGSLNARFGKSLIPRGEGELVRVAGKVGDYYITEILNGTGIHEDYEPIKEAVDDGTIPTSTTVQQAIDAVAADVAQDFVDAYAAIAAGDTANQDLINQQISDVNGTVSSTITAYGHEYATSDSETVAPTTGWSTTQPTRTPGTFIWFRTTVTRVNGTTVTTEPALLTGNTGATGSAGTPAALVNVTATSQALVSPPGGGATTPATSTVTGTATNTTITVVEFSENSGAWTTTNPAGVSGTDATRTITGASMTAATIAVRMKDAEGVSDTITIAKVSNGASGGAGADGYTVVLTNEAQVFAGSTTAALDASATSQVIAYKGATQQAVTIGTITGQVTGLNTSVQNNGTTTAGFTVNVTSALTQQSGELVVPVTFDGKTFNKTFSWSVSRTGATGGAGANAPTITDVTTFYQQTADTVNSVATPSGATPGGSWVTTPPAYAANTRLWRTDRITFSDATYTYTTPVRDQAYEASLFAITSANGKNKVTHSQSAPGSTANSAGDTWFQYADAGLTKLTSYWRGTGGTTWVEADFDVTIIPQIDIGTGTFGSLNGARLTARTVGAEKLFVGDLTNYIADGNLEDPTFQSWDSNGLTRVKPADDVAYIEWATNASGNAHRYNKHQFQVTPGEKYYFEAEVSTPSTNTTSVYLVMALQTYDHAGGTVTWPQTAIGNFGPNTGWTKISGQIEIPPGNTQVKGVFDPFTSATSAGQVIRMRKMVLRKKATGELIVDGAIRAIHITADMVNGLIVTGGVIQTNQNGPAYGTTATGVKISSSGLVTYNNSGQATFSLSTNGSISMNGNLASAIITGATVRTSSSNPRVEMNSSGIYAYNSVGSQTFSITSTGGDGSFAGTVASAATITGTLTGDKINGGIITGTTFATSTSSSEGIKISNSHGISALSGGNALFHVSTSGHVTMNTLTAYGNDLGVSGGLSLYNSGGKQGNLYVQNSLTVAYGLATFGGGINTSTISGGPKINGSDVTIDSLRDGGGNNVQQGPKYVRAGAGGILYAHTTAPGASSREMKHDITPLDIDFRTILALTPVNFKYNSDPDLPLAGFIAEEADELELDQFVAKEDWDNPGKPTGFYYDFFDAALLHVDREQQKLIDDLHTRIEELESRLSK